MLKAGQPIPEAQRPDRRPNWVQPSRNLIEGMLQGTHKGPTWGTSFTDGPVGRKAQLGPNGHVAHKECEGEPAEVYNGETHSRKGGVPQPEAKLGQITPFEKTAPMRTFEFDSMAMGSACAHVRFALIKR